jgi:two-component system response regulator
MIVNSIEILLVEDDAGDAGLIARALQKSDLANKMVHVWDGQEALDLLFGKEVSMPKLVLLDLKLPRVDGIEVLRKLKADPGTKAIPVVMLTSSNQQKDVQACYDLGANSYIVKPVEYRFFIEAVTEIGNYWLLRNQLPG